MYIECPKCTLNIDTELTDFDMPDRACDDAELQCPECNHVFVVGWYAELEVRESNL